MPELTFTWGDAVRFGACEPGLNRMRRALGYPDEINQDARIPVVTVIDDHRMWGKRDEQFAFYYALGGDWRIVDRVYDAAERILDMWACPNFFTDQVRSQYHSRRRMLRALLRGVAGGHYPGILAAAERGGQ